MTDTDEVLVYLQQAKARVEGGGAANPTSGTDAVRYARSRLEEALPYAHAGGELPADARLRPVKQAVIGAVRPVISNQAPFNKAVLQALDGAAAAIEGLADSVDVSDQHLNRVQAGHGHRRPHRRRPGGRGPRPAHPARRADRPGRRPPGPGLGAPAPAPAPSAS